MSPGTCAKLPGMAEPKRIYQARMGRSLSGSGIGLMGMIAGCSYGMQQALRDDEPGVALSVVLGTLALFGVLCALLALPRTTVTDEGIDVRRGFATRRYRWIDIDDIGLDRERTQGLRPTGPAVVIDTAGGRIALPNVSAHQLGDDQAVERELAYLREMWVRDRP